MVSNELSAISLRDPDESLPMPDADVSLFERLARDPNVSREKLEYLIAMRERLLASRAKTAFNTAYIALQADLPEIMERGQIEKNGKVRNTYAPLEDIHAIVKPILKIHGFAIRHRTEWPADKPQIIRIVGILIHECGHQEESAFEAPIDKSEYRTDIQSMGSTVSYGRRYTTRDLLNLATRGEDTDGEKTSHPPTAPAGFDDWWLDLVAVADEGIPRLQATWAASKPEYRNYVWQHRRHEWAAIKEKARLAIRSNSE